MIGQPRSVRKAFALLQRGRDGSKAPKSELELMFLRDDSTAQDQAAGRALYRNPKDCKDNNSENNSLVSIPSLMSFVSLQSLFRLFCRAGS